MSTATFSLAKPDSERSDAGAGIVLVRDSTDADLAAVHAIYAHHVAHQTGTFEEEPPNAAEMAARRKAILGRCLPYLSAVIDGKVQGFAYVAPFRPRSAYRYTVEDSIYVHPAATGRGIGRALLGELIVRCEALGFRQMVAVIGDSANARSIRLHAAADFRHAGVLHSAGFKFGRWLDAVFMQRPLGKGGTDLP